MTKPITSVFIDSSAWISYVILTDVNYPKASAVFQSFTAKTKLYTSLFIIDETVTKLRKTLGQNEAYKFYRQLNKIEEAKLLTILPLDRKEVIRAVNILQKYPTPNTFSLTDATNIVLIQQYGILSLFSFDKDFHKLKIPDLIILHKV